MLRHYCQQGYARNARHINQRSYPITLAGLTAWAPIARLIGSMNWCLLYSENNNYFLCADNPCAILDPDFDNDGIGGIGIGGPNVEITLPISKNHCLIASPHSIPDSMRVSPYQVKNINKRASLFGDRFFAYPIKDDKILKFLISCRKVAPKTMAESVPTENGYRTITRQNIFDSPEHASFYRNISAIFPSR